MKKEPLAIEVYKEKLDFIKKYYHDHDLTSYEIAMGVGMTPSTINRIFKGQTKRPGQNTVRMIYDYIIENYVNKSDVPIPEPIEKDTNNNLYQYSIDEIIGNLLERQEECLNNTSYIAFKRMLGQELKYENVYEKLEKHDKILDRILKNQS